MRPPESCGAKVRALKAAVPVPMEIVMAWDLGVLEHDSKEPLKAILYWQMATMAHTSMRFYDALHTSPDLITERGGGVRQLADESREKTSRDSLRSWFGIIEWTPMALHRYGRASKDST